MADTLNQTTERPVRVQLRRAAGWRMPPNTVKVDRTTKWGNPFVVGQDGTAEECVDLYRKLLSGYACLSQKVGLAEQSVARTHVNKNLSDLRGKSLACWCRAGAPCHADVLLRIANAK